MKILADNKRANFEYTILQKWQAGLKLTGPEVKTAKLGQIDLKGAYVTLESMPGKLMPEAWLVGAHIAKYAPAGYSQNHYNPLRKRKLLLNKKEIAELIGKTKQKGLTVLPLLVYTSQRLVKLEIGLGQGKKKFDKRETIKKREFERSKQRLMK
ncbi:MAG: SsrA-binding protein SmpB [Patescibacteria group bacterium]|jgi:SsrA-binding protein